MILLNSNILPKYSHLSILFDNLIALFINQYCKGEYKGYLSDGTYYCNRNNRSILNTKFDFCMKEVSEDYLYLKNGIVNTMNINDFPKTIDTLNQNHSLLGL